MGGGPGPKRTGAICRKVLTALVREVRLCLVVVVEFCFGLVGFGTLGKVCIAFRPSFELFIE